MRKHALRLLLGSGYVIFLTILLLYQMGALGGRREWTVAVMGTLFLGVALAVVLMLYLRVSDQMKRREENRDGFGIMTVENQGETEKNTAPQNSPVSGGSYEEIYAHFLTVMEACALSERELEVAWLLYRGYTNRQIGEALYIAETTVKKHVSHIYQKLDVQSRKEFRARVQTTAAPIPPPSQTDLHE